MLQQGAAYDGKFLEVVDVEAKQRVAHINLTIPKKILISTLNQYSYCIAEKDTAFKKALIGSDVLLSDGIGIVVAARLLNNKKITKITGADVHEYLLKKLDREKGSFFYLGSSEETLTKITQRIAQDYPNISLGTHSLTTF